MRLGVPFSTEKEKEPWPEPEAQILITSSNLFRRKILFWWVKQEVEVAMVTN